MHSVIINVNNFQPEILGPAQMRRIVSRSFWRLISTSTFCWWGGSIFDHRIHFVLSLSLPHLEQLQFWNWIFNPIPCHNSGAVWSYEVFPCPLTPKSRITEYHFPLFEEVLILFLHSLFPSEYGSFNAPYILRHIRVWNIMRLLCCTQTPKS